MSRTSMPSRIGADDLGIVVVGAGDDEPALLEAVVAGQRRTDLAGADDDHPPVASQAEDLPQPSRQFGHRVAKSALAEGAEKGEVLPHLSGGRAAPLGELIARDRGQAATLEILEKSEVGGQPANGRIGNTFHGNEPLVNSFTRYTGVRPDTTHGAPVSFGHARTHFLRNRPPAGRRGPHAGTRVAGRNPEYAGRLPLRRHHRRRRGPAGAPAVHRPPGAVRDGLPGERPAGAGAGQLGGSRTADPRDDGHRALRTAGPRPDGIGSLGARADADRGPGRGAGPACQGAQRARLHAAPAPQPVLHARQRDGGGRPRARGLDALRHPVAGRTDHEVAVRASPGAGECGHPVRRRGRAPNQPHARRGRRPSAAARPRGHRVQRALQSRRPSTSWRRCSSSRRRSPTSSWW